MRVGIISDIHGNTHALEAALNELSRLRVEQIVCLGDSVNPLPGSFTVFAKLEALNIPILLGNHEDYIVRCFERPDDPINHAPNFEPVRVLAKRFSRELVEKLKQLPMTMSLNDQQAGDCLLVHASPLNNRLGYRYGIDAEMERQLLSTSANTIVCGHWHDPETRVWQGKRLVTNGSVGVPLRGQIKAEFLILESIGTEWTVEHHSVSYDNKATLKDYRESGLITEGGPITWLFYDEIRTAEKRLSAYIQWANAHGRSYSTFENMALSAREFLVQLGSWSAISSITLDWTPHLHSGNRGD